MINLVTDSSLYILVSLQVLATSHSFGKVQCGSFSISVLSSSAFLVAVDTGMHYPDCYSQQLRRRGVSPSSLAGSMGTNWCAGKWSAEHDPFAKEREHLVVYSQQEWQNENSPFFVIEMSFNLHLAFWVACDCRWRL